MLVRFARHLWCLGINVPKPDRLVARPRRQLGAVRRKVKLDNVVGVASDGGRALGDRADFEDCLGLVNYADDCFCTDPKLVCHARQLCHNLPRESAAVGVVADIKQSGSNACISNFSLIKVPTSVCGALFTC